MEADQKDALGEVRSYLQHRRSCWLQSRAPESGGYCDCGLNKKLKEIGLNPLEDI